MHAWTGNKRDLAALFEVSAPTIDAWVRRGCPVQTKGRSGIDWSFDFRQVRAWREKMLMEIAAAEANRSDTSVAEAVCRKATAEATLKELELAERKHELVAVESVVRDMASIFKNVSTRLQSVAVKCAPLLAACRRESQFQAVLSKHICEALHELSDLPFLSVDSDSIPECSETAGATSGALGEPMGGPLPDAQPRKQRRAGQMGHR